MTVSAIDRTPWWNSLTRAQWNTLLASNLGWLFDGYETYIGYAGFGFLADAFGRKPVTLFYVAAALITVPVMFLFTHDLGMLLVMAGLLGVFVSGQYTWMSAWLPELFPTRMRATAAGFVFNMPRLIAWVGPLISGWIIANFGGFGRAATAVALIYIISLAAAPFLPETNGKPLPE